MWAVARGAILLALQVGTSGRPHRPQPFVVEGFTIELPAPDAHAACALVEDFARRNALAGTSCRHPPGRMPESVLHQAPMVRTAILWRRPIDEAPRMRVSVY
jgi:hypothetical protein